MNTRLYRQGLAICGALIAFFATGSLPELRAQELLVNPGFEDTSGLTTTQQNFINSNGYLPIIPVDSTSLNGWSVVNNGLVPPGTSNLDLVNSTFLVHTGNYALDLVGTGAGSTLGEIQQTVSLSAGSYVLSFWVAHFQGTADSNPYLNVSIGGVLAQGISLPSASGTWQQITIYFNIATTGNYTLDFAALREITSDSGAYLDDISIMVPEASTIWMAAITLALVARFSWKRFRVVLAQVA
jgi:hypothetical protein